MNNPAASNLGSQRCPCGAYGCTVLQSHRRQVSDELSVVYADYSAPLLAFTRNRMRSQGVSEAQIGAEDIVHDAFAAVTRLWFNVREPRAYLFSIIRHRLQDEALLDGRRADLRDLASEANLTNAWWTSTVDQPSPEGVESKIQIQQILAELSPRQRVATYLAHVERLSHAEISDLLGCAPSTVEVHVSKAKTELKKQYPSGPTAMSPGAMSPRAALARTMTAVTRARLLSKRSIGIGVGVIAAAAGLLYAIVRTGGSTTSMPWWSLVIGGLTLFVAGLLTGLTIGHRRTRRPRAPKAVAPQTNTAGKAPARGDRGPTPRPRPAPPSPQEPADNPRPKSLRTSNQVLRSEMRHRLAPRRRMQRRTARRR